MWFADRDCRATTRSADPANHSCTVQRQEEMSVVSHTSTNRQFGFHAVRAAYARLRLSALPTVKELWKVILALAVYFAIMATFVALGVWMWLPPFHQWH